MAIGAWGFCPYVYKADRNRVTKKNVLKSAISRQAKVSKLPLVFWLNEIVLKSAISRQAKVSKLPLVFWLNEIVFLVIVISPPLISHVLSGV